MALITQDWSSQSGSAPMSYIPPKTETELLKDRIIELQKELITLLKKEA